MSSNMTPDSAANARLCAWLGIAPTHAIRRCESCQKKRYVYDRPIDVGTPLGCGCCKVPIYPALDTRDGFWILWDALKAKGQLPRVKAQIDGNTSAWMATRESQSVEAQVAVTPEAALFAAAVALMEREGN